MPFYDWSLLTTRSLHPNIGIPADDSQGLPFLGSFDVLESQNYGLVAKTYSGSNSLTGFLFTAENRYLLGNGAALNLANISPSVPGMFAIDGLSNHVFATTQKGIINAPIVVSGNNIGWKGGQWPNPLGGGTNTWITFFNYDGSNYVGFGNSFSNNFEIFKPGGVNLIYSVYAAFGPFQPATFYNGIYAVGSGFTARYGFVPASAAPVIVPYYCNNCSFISFSFTESALLFAQSASGEWFGYNGVDDPTQPTAFQKIPFALNSQETFGYDPVAHKLLSISPNIITNGGKSFYPVYVYSAIVSTPHYFALQRNFAHNYARGAPINGGLQNAIIQAPNTNIIL